MTVSLPGTDIGVPNRYIASAFRLLRLQQALSLLMCAEFPGCLLGRPHDLVLLYMAMPFGWIGAPANFAIFGDAISRMHACQVWHGVAGLVLPYISPFKTILV